MGRSLPSSCGSRRRPEPYASVLTTTSFSRDSSSTPHGVSGCVRKLRTPYPDVRCPLRLGEGGLAVMPPTSTWLSPGKDWGSRPDLLTAVLRAAEGGRRGVARAEAQSREEVRARPGEAGLGHSAARVRTPALIQRRCGFRVVTSAPPVRTTSAPAHSLQGLDRWLLRRGSQHPSRAGPRRAIRSTPSPRHHAAAFLPEDHCSSKPRLRARGLQCPDVTPALQGLKAGHRTEPNTWGVRRAGTEGGPGRLQGRARRGGPGRGGLHSPHRHSTRVQATPPPTGHSHQGLPLSTPARSTPCPPCSLREPSSTCRCDLCPAEGPPGLLTALGTESALQPGLHCSAPHPLHTRVCAHTDTRKLSSQHPRTTG